MEGLAFVGVALLLLLWLRFRSKKPLEINPPDPAPKLEPETTLLRSVQETRLEKLVQRRREAKEVTDALLGKLGALTAEEKKRVSRPSAEKNLSSSISNVAVPFTLAEKKTRSVPRAIIDAPNRVLVAKTRPQPQLCKFLRLRILRTRDRFSPEVQLCMIRFFSRNAELKVVRAENPDGRNNFGEGPERSIDGRFDTKWFDASIAENDISQLHLELQTSTIIEKYEIVTANDVPSRDPVSWELFGSLNADGPFAIIDRRKSAFVPTERLCSTGALTCNWGFSEPGFNVEGSRVVYYRFDFKYLQHWPATALQLGGLSVYDEHGEKIPIATLSHPGGSPRSNPDALLTTGEWVDDAFGENAVSCLVLCCSGEKKLHHYEMVTGGGDLSGDPTDWTVRLSDNGIDWTLLDSRSYVDPPVPRRAAYPLFECNMGRDSHGVLAGREKVKSWQQGAALCPEYEEARSRLHGLLCEDLISSSPISTWTSTLKERLENMQQTPADVRKQFLTLISTMVKDAYGLTRSEDVKAQTCNLNEGVPILDHAMHLYTRLAWRGPLFFVALTVITEKEELHVSEVIAILSLVVKGGKDCLARALAVFTSIIQRAYQIIRMDKPLLGDSRQALKEAVQLYIEEHKTSAFVSAFVEPTKFFFQTRGNERAANDDVHSSNLYATVLLATLNIRFGISADLEDVIAGAVPYLRDRSAAHKFYNLFLMRENFGRTVGGIRECQEYLEGIKGGGDGGGDRDFIVPRARTPRDVACALADPSPVATAFRKEAATYLNRFVSLFTDDFIVPRIISSILNNEGLSSSLDCEFQRGGFAAEVEALGLSGVREWLYPPDDYILVLDRAIRLLRYLDVLK